MSLQQRITALAQAVGADIKQLQQASTPGSFFSLVTVTATSIGQTSFTIPGGYTPGAIFVSLNGASLPPSDYAATNGTTVVLASGSGIVAGSVLLVHVLSAFEVADALPLGGTAFDSARYAGLLPPPNDGKTYALSDGAWVEVEGGGGGIWGSITGTLADQTDLASALAAKAAASDIDFTIIYPNGGSAASPANVSVNTEYEEISPFPGYHLIVKAEVFRNGRWASTGWTDNYSGNAAGVVAEQVGDTIAVQTGSVGTAYRDNVTGGGHGINTGNIVTTPLPCRVLVWKVKGAAT